MNQDFWANAWEEYVVTSTSSPGQSQLQGQPRIKGGEIVLTPWYVRLQGHMVKNTDTKRGGKLGLTEGSARTQHIWPKCLSFSEQLGNHGQHGKKKSLGLKELHSRANTAAYCHLKGEVVNFSELTSLSANRVNRWHSHSWVYFRDQIIWIFFNPCVPRWVLKVIIASLNLSSQGGCAISSLWESHSFSSPSSVKRVWILLPWSSCVKHSAQSRIAAVILGALWLQNSLEQ